MWRIGVFGLCWLALLLPVDTMPMTSMVDQAIVMHGLFAGINIWTMSPGAQIGGAFYVAAIVALALSRPLFVSRQASLAHLAGMGLAFWFFPFVVGQRFGMWGGERYVSEACDAMLVGALAAELLFALTQSGARSELRNATLFVVKRVSRTYPAHPRVPPAPSSLAARSRAPRW